MAWQGVPFRVPFDLNEYISIGLNSIPKIILESSTDYWGLLLTAGAALAGGIIPALIAWRTFNQNSKLLKSERKLQHDFLIGERGRQEDFLNKQMAEQNKSLEADRQTQITVAEKNFNMQVLSANRQAWINTFRDLISEYCVETNKNLTELSEQQLMNIQYNSYDAAYKKFPENLEAKRLYEKALSELASAQKTLEDTQYSIDRIKYKIILMINPNEDEANTIMQIMKSMRVKIATFGREQESYENIYHGIYKDTEALISITHKLLKKEWERVKKGR